MSLPIRVFWLLNSNIPRLMAERDLRLLGVTASSHTTQAITEIRETLAIELGEVMVVDPVEGAICDTHGLEELRAMQ